MSKLKAGYRIMLDCGKIRNSQLEEIIDYLKDHMSKDKMRAEEGSWIDGYSTDAAMKIFVLQDNLRGAQQFHEASIEQWVSTSNVGFCIACSLTQISGEKGQSDRIWWLEESSDS